MTKSIILTGSKGLIGRSLEKFLKEKNYEIIGLDLESELHIEENVREIMAKNTKPNYLINTFAINDHIDPRKKNYSPLDSKLDELRQYLEINVTSLFSVCREFIKTRNSGRIINFSSIYGLVTPNPSLYEQGAMKHIGYPISKSAVISLSNYLAVKYSPEFSVNTLAIGGVLNNQSESFIERYSANVPLKRMMNIEEIFPSILFLLNDDNSYMTGSTLTIDGGFSII